MQCAYVVSFAFSSVQKRKKKRGAIEKDTNPTVHVPAVRYQARKENIELNKISHQKDEQGYEHMAGVAYDDSNLYEPAPEMDVYS